MANNDVTRSAARNALRAYQASEGMTEDDETSIIDLIADLAFLAEYDLDISGEYVIERGAWHFTEDKAEQENEDEELDDDDDDDDVIDVEPLDDYREVLQDSGTVLEIER